MDEQVKFNRPGRRLEFVRQFPDGREKLIAAFTVGEDNQLFSHELRLAGQLPPGEILTVQGDQQHVRLRMRRPEARGCWEAVFHVRRRADGLRYFEQAPQPPA